MLAGAYLQSGSEEEPPLKPYLVHRLDKQTSGLMCLAKTREMAKFLSQAMTEHKVEKEYLALICNFTEHFPFPRCGVIRQSLEEPERLWSV